MADTSEEMSQHELSRRQFMDSSIKAIGAFIGITLGVPAVGYLISPALQKQEGQWIRLGRASQVEIGVPTLFTVTLDETTGWVKSEINFTVMSNICTHLGCQTHWSDEEGSIVCPCHGGHFDVQGQVISGPPPRPLRRVEYSVDENKNILIQEV
jgi:menaquinol-cytochrome c reductase iron-sulfur subunit